MTKKNEDLSKNKLYIESIANSSKTIERLIYGQSQSIKSLMNHDKYKEAYKIASGINSYKTFGTDWKNKLPNSARSSIGGLGNRLNIKNRFYNDNMIKIHKDLHSLFSTLLYSTLESGDDKKLEEYFNNIDALAKYGYTYIENPGANLEIYEEEFLSVKEADDYMHSYIKDEKVEDLLLEMYENNKISKYDYNEMRLAYKYGLYKAYIMLVYAKIDEANSIFAAKIDCKNKNVYTTTSNKRINKFMKKQKNRPVVYYIWERSSYKYICDIMESTSAELELVDKHIPNRNTLMHGTSIREITDLDCIKATLAFKARHEIFDIVDEISPNGGDEYEY